jgi:hypothetical protein
MKFHPLRMLKEFGFVPYNQNTSLNFVSSSRLYTLQNSKIYVHLRDFLIRTGHGSLFFLSNSWAPLFKPNRYVTGQAYMSGQSALQRKTCNHRQHIDDKINFIHITQDVPDEPRQLSQHTDWPRAGDRGSTAGKDKGFSLHRYVQMGQISPSVLSETCRGLFHKHLRLLYTRQGRNRPVPRNEHTENTTSEQELACWTDDTQDSSWCVKLWYKFARFLIMELGKCAVVFI